MINLLIAYLVYCVAVIVIINYRYKKLNKGKLMNDTLQTYYDKNNGRLPTGPIPEEVKECKDNKALKVFK